MQTLLVSMAWCLGLETRLAALGIVTFKILPKSHLTGLRLGRGHSHYSFLSRTKFTLSLSAKEVICFLRVTYSCSRKRGDYRNREEVRFLLSAFVKKEGQHFKDYSIITGVQRHL